MSLTSLRAAALANQVADLANRLNRTDFVVGPHQRDKHSVGPDRGVHVFESDDTVIVNRQPRDFPTAFLESIANSSDRWMFNGGSDYVPSIVGGSFAKAANGEVVRFRSPGSEDDLVRFRADQSRYFAPGAIDRGARLLAKSMHTRRVTVVFGQRAGHRGRDTRVHGRRGTVIQVNPVARCHFSRVLTPQPPAGRPASELVRVFSILQKHGLV